jgi:ATP/maltotriose-dependent transcriptional regulator MalT
VSALHAVIERQAGELTLLDDGLSRNGSFVNEHAVHGMTRLRDGDMVRFGRTVALVRHPTNSHRNSTLSAPRPAVSPDLSDLQRAVLNALCRPLTESDALASPATNQVIANHLHLSVAAVKLHLRVLFEKFDVGHLPQNSKRLALAHRALDSGTLNHNRAR